MNSGPESSSWLDSTSPLELALDRAMDRYHAAELSERAERRTERRREPTTALVVTSGESALATLPARLSWRGIEVSEEFQRYAARVARGEQLAPYRGQVLARQCAEFPWGTVRHAPRRSPTPLLGRSAKVTAMLLSMGTALLAAIGVGSGTASTLDDELERAFPDQQMNTLLPAPYVVDAEPLVNPNSAEEPVGVEKTAAKGTGPRRASVSRATRRRSRTPTLMGLTATTATQVTSATLASAEASASTAADADPFGIATSGAAPASAPVATGSGAKSVASASTLPGAALSKTSTTASPPSRAGLPSDWDPTGKMSPLFSDEPTF
jgi:hypothetical protein